MGAIIDTSFIIPMARTDHKPADVIVKASTITGTDVLAVSVITILELTHGIYRPTTPENAVRRKLFVDELCLALPILDITLSVARRAGQMDGELATQNKTVGLADLLIGVTALDLGYSVLTLNTKHFQLIAGLTIHS